MESKSNGLMQGRHYHFMVYDDLVPIKNMGEDIMEKQDKILTEEPAPLKISRIEILEAKLAEAEKLIQYYASPAQTVVTPSGRTSATTEKLRLTGQKAYRYGNMCALARTAAQQFPVLERYIILPHFDLFEQVEY